jgi:hypothetical protein
MKTILLKGILDKKAYPDAGEYIFKDIKDSIITHDKVIIDMIDVLSLPTMFLNTSIGAIIDEFGIQRLKESIGFRNISKSEAERIQKYIIDYNQIIKNNLNI